MCFKYYLVIIALYTFLACNNKGENKIPPQNNLDSGLSKILKEIKTPDGKVLISAHRGDWRNAPENSLQSIQNCIDMGIDIIEVDIRKTKDGTLILMHDETLDRTTTGSGKVLEWTVDSLQFLNLKNGISLKTSHKIPTLENALKLAKNKILLYLDKSMDYMPETLKLLERLNMFDNVVFMHPITYLEAKTIFGDYLNQVNLIARIEPHVENPKQFVDDYINSGFRPLAFQLRETPEQLKIMDYINENNFRICVSTIWPQVSANHDDEKAIIDPEGNWGWQLEKHVSIFNTDRPKLLLDYLRTKDFHD